MHTPQLYKDFERQLPARVRIRARLRSTAARSLAPWGRSRPHWLRFVYLHHVFADERGRFAEQLRYYQQIAEVISLDQAVGMLRSGDPIDGRYLCLNFDDGFANQYEHAFPLLMEAGLTASFFLPTDYLSAPLREGGSAQAKAFGLPDSFPIPFMSWEQAREMAEAGMTLGSHTQSHAALRQLNPDELLGQLRASKALIETRTGQSCRHFCPPFGQIGRDLQLERDLPLIREAGFESLQICQRGTAHNIDSGGLAVCQRDHMMAHWSLSELRYFLNLRN